MAIPARYPNGFLLTRKLLKELEEAGRKDTPEWREVAKLANIAQRQLARDEAEKKVALAQQARRTASPALRAESDKAVADAIRAFTSSEAALQSPASLIFTGRATPSYPALSTGRRLAFARWIADRENPLAARVAVNHLWLRHFGQALVPSVSEFGRNGQAPTHPALLDWLASEFMDRGWRMKELHRLIVSSAT